MFGKKKTVKVTKGYAGREVACALKSHPVDPRRLGKASKQVARRADASRTNRGWAK